MMREFGRRLKQLRRDEAGRRWVYVPYDQLTDRIGPLADDEPQRLGIVLVESTWKAARRPYHKQKLAFILANQRHFALEQAARGVAVRYLTTDGPYAAALEPVADELGPLTVMEPAERELREDLAPLVAKGKLVVVPHAGWLTNIAQFEDEFAAGPPYRMDKFYRRVRRDSGILMQRGKPVGGKFSFDVENRRPWRGEPTPPALPRLDVDRIKAEVGELITTRFAHHPGTLDLEQLPATAAEAQLWWRHMLAEALPQFGPFEDAMSRSARSLFHTRISALVNVHRLLPADVVADAAKSDAPLACREGFVRQVLGWREFVRHVHRATDGFRELADGATSVASLPGDGGYERWAGKRWSRAKTKANQKPDGGAMPSFLGSDRPLPPAYWGTESGLACLDTVVGDVWAEAYSHHITRLMVLSNLATLLDVSPRELTDWFWVAYVDAFDWVVEPNVLGMGTFAVGELMTTKPYIAGSAYIDRMSDYCDGCAFDPKSTCPITRLYWAFLNRHATQLAKNPRLLMPMRAAAKRSAEMQRGDAALFERVSELLTAGERLPTDVVQSATS